MYTECLWGSRTGNSITCMGIFLMCVNNVISEKNTRFRSLFFMQHWDSVILKLSTVAYIIPPCCVVEFVLFLQNFRPQLVTHAL
jgi:hypothetical protein